MTATQKTPAILRLMSKINDYLVGSLLRQNSSLCSRYPEQVKMLRMERYSLISEDVISRSLRALEAMFGDDTKDTKEKLLAVRGLVQESLQTYLPRESSQLTDLNNQVSRQGIETVNFWLIIWIKRNEFRVYMFNFSVKIQISNKSVRTFIFENKTTSLNTTPMTQTPRSTINKLYPMKLKSFCKTKDTIKETKKTHLTERKKILPTPYLIEV